MRRYVGIQSRTLCIQRGARDRVRFRTRAATLSDAISILGRTSSISASSRPWVPTIVPVGPSRPARRGRVSWQAGGLAKHIRGIACARRQAQLEISDTLSTSAWLKYLHAAGSRKSPAAYPTAGLRASMPRARARNPCARSAVSSVPPSSIASAHALATGPATARSERGPARGWPASRSTRAS